MYLRYADIAAATAAADRVLAAREDHDDDEFSTFDATSGDDESSEESEKGIALDFRNVWFSYPTRPDVPVLKGLDLQVSCCALLDDFLVAKVRLTHFRISGQERRGSGNRGVFRVG